jgi:hypothetical protein
LRYEEQMFKVPFHSFPILGKFLLDMFVQE